MAAQRGSLHCQGRWFELMLTIIRAMPEHSSQMLASILSFSSSAACSILPVVVKKRMRPCSLIPTTAKRVGKCLRPLPL